MDEKETANNKINSIIDLTLEKIKKLADVEVVIGKPIISENKLTIISVSKVTYGFASGGSDLKSKDLFGGGSGAGVTVVPIAFLVIKDGDVKLLQIESFCSALDRIIAMAPDIADKINNFFKKQKEKKTYEK